MLFQKPCCLIDHIIESTCRLQGRRSRNNAHNDEHHINGDGAGFLPKNEYQQEHTYHAVDAQANTAHFGTNEYHSQNDEQLECQ